MKVLTISLLELASQTGQFVSEMQCTFINTCSYKSIKLVHMIYELTGPASVFWEIMARHNT